MTRMQSYKEKKKKFDKSSEHFYKLLHNNLSLSHKKKDQQLQEHDKELMVQKTTFHGDALNYVYTLQEIQQTNKFQFVQICTDLMKTLFRYFKSNNDLCEDQRPYINEIKQQIEAEKEEFEATQEKSRALMSRMPAHPEQSKESFMSNRWSRCGYLLMLEHRSGVRLTSKWSRSFCTFNKESKLFQMASPFVSSSSVLVSSNKSTGSGAGVPAVVMDSCIVISCTGRLSDSIDRRFCFDIEVEDIGAGSVRNFTCQALSDEDKKKWMMVMGGKEPVDARDVKVSANLSSTPADLHL